MVCVIGDGSVTYSIQALCSAARYEANVVVVVINNKEYSILKGVRDAIGIDDTVPGLDVPNIGHVRLASGFGVTGETVEEACSRDIGGRSGRTVEDSASSAVARVCAVPFVSPASALVAVSRAPKTSSSPGLSAKSLPA